MSFYKKFVNKYPRGYSLRGGPFARWRYPLQRVLYKKRLVAGPEPERPRSVWSNWNYESELYAFGHRLGETFDESLLRKAFTHPCYAIAEKTKLEEIGVTFDEMQNNLQQSEEGEKICKLYLKSVLRFWYKNLPEQGIDSIVNYLTSLDTISNVARNMGFVDLVRSQDFPVKKDTVYSCFMAVISALAESNKSVTRSHLFINDFLLTQLIDKDINEIWHISNPTAMLEDELKKRNMGTPVNRLIWSTGMNNPAGAFIVGVYVDQEMIGKGGGETLEIAEEMATRDALKRLFGTTEDSMPLPYGDRARIYSSQINQVYESYLKQSNSSNSFSSLSQ